MIGASLASGIADYFSSIAKKLSRRGARSLTEKTDQDFVFEVIAEKRVPNLTQLKYLTKFYSPTELLATKTALFLALASSLALGVLLYQNNLVRKPAHGGEYAEAAVGAPTYINPLFAQTNDVDQDIARLVFGSLMKLDENGSLVPDLAESYSIDESQTTYTVTLRPNVRWHDGEPLTTRDVAFTVQSIQDPAFKSPLYATFRNVRAQAIDEYTISFTLAEPFAPFLSVMTFGILPEHLWSNIDPAHAILAELNLKPVGSGPYRFDQFIKDRNGNIKEYRLKRFSGYYNEGPFVEKVALKFFGSFEEAYAAFGDGNVDGIGFLPQHQTTSATGQAAVHKFSLPQYTALFFNQEANAALKEKNVRLALSLATSKREIIDNAFGGEALPVAGPILPGMLGYTERASGTLFDPAQAEKLLDDAGWKRIATDDGGAAGPAVTRGSATLGAPDQTRPPYTRQKNNAELSLTLTAIQREDSIIVAETLRDLWQGIGVKVNLNIVEVASIQKDVIKPRAYEVLLFGQIIGKDPDPYPFWHSSQANDPGLNLALYQNKAVDALLEDARKTSDPKTREEKYATFQKQVSDDVPAIFLYSLQYTYLTPGNLKGIATERINHPSDRFSNIASWYIKTKKRLQF
ncbi:MAG: peptide ABC transporter substrate-binding protein [Parcubacteria group bacterium]|nr:peptide ABC transporter substrate-binding protein [Parcubacteria group bacterium]